MKAILLTQCVAKLYTPNIVEYQCASTLIMNNQASIEIKNPKVTKKAALKRIDFLKKDTSPLGALSSCNDKPLSLLPKKTHQIINTVGKINSILVLRNPDLPSSTLSYPASPGFKPKCS